MADSSTQDDSPLQPPQSGRTTVTMLLNRKNGRRQTRSTTKVDDTPPDRRSLLNRPTTQQAPPVLTAEPSFEIKPPENPSSPSWGASFASSDVEFLDDNDFHDDPPEPTVVVNAGGPAKRVRVSTSYH
jgi:hypothetical protein